MQQEKKLFIRQEKPGPQNKFESMKSLENPYVYQTIQNPQQKIQRSMIVQHQHTQNCQHDLDIQEIDQMDDQHAGHNHSPRKGKHHHRKGNQAGQKNYCIILYTVFTILSCEYLLLYYFSSMYANFSYRLTICLMSFTVFMSLWAYYKTIVISNAVINIKSLKYFPKKHHVDPMYNFSHKTCKFCDNYKLPRVSHCSNCGHCIYKLDHHCVWTQNCIGYRNHRTFYLFTFYMFIGVLQYLFHSYYYMGFLWSKPSFWEFNQPTFYILWFVTNCSVCIVGIMIAMLFFVHTNLIFTNTTTLDMIKARECFPIPFLQCRNEMLNKINPFDRGQIANIVNFFGGDLWTFWMPLQRNVTDEICVQKLNPEPTKLQIFAWHQEIAKQQFQRQQQMKSFLDNVHSLYKGKRMKINQIEIQL